MYDYIQKTVAKTFGLQTPQDIANAARLLNEALDRAPGTTIEQRLELIAKQNPTLGSLFEGSSLQKKLALQARLYTDISDINSQISAQQENHYLQAQVPYGRSSKEQIFREVDRLQNFYMFQAVVQAVGDDVASPNPTTNNVVTISSQIPEVDALLKRMQDQIDIDSLISLALPEILTYGEYYFKIHKKGDSLEVKDNVLQSSMLTFYKNSEISHFYSLIPESVDNISKDPHIKSPDSYMVFQLRKRRIKLNDQIFRNHNLLGGADGPLALIRMGSPLLYPAFDRLRSLMIAELVPEVSLFSSLDTATTLFLSLPDNYSPQQSMQACKQYEDLLNRNALAQIFYHRETVPTADDLANSVKFKVLPSHGSKGNLDQRDFRHFQDLVSTQDLEDKRKAVLFTVGVPESVVMGGEKKFDSIRVFIRYIRLVRSIQQDLKRSLVHLSSIYLRHKGYDKFLATDIEVKFENSLVSLEELDALEFQDTAIGMLERIIGFYERLSDLKRNNPHIFKAASKVLDKYTKSIGLGNLEDIPVPPPSLPDQNPEGFSFETET